MKGLQQTVRKSGCLFPERHTDNMRPGSNADSSLQPGLDIGFRGGRADRRSFFIRAAAHQGAMNYSPVHGDDHLVFKIQPANFGRSVNGELRLEYIFGVEREIMADQNTTACAKR